MKNVVSGIQCFIIIFHLILCFPLHAQVQNNAIRQYNQFRQQARQEYDDFRRQCNEEYAEFLKQAWQSYASGPVIPVPEEKPVPPVVMPDEDKDKTVEPQPIIIDETVSPVIEEPEPQPKPVAPIHEHTEPTTQYFSFTFFGTEGRVRVPKTKSTALMALSGGFDNKSLSAVWQELSGSDYDNLVRDCLELRIRHNLCDWAYLMMLQKLGDAYCGEKTNASTMLTAWLYCQSGYEMRLASAGDHLYLLFGSKHLIYGLPNFSFEDTYFYPLLHQDEELAEYVDVCDVPYPNEEPLSLFLLQDQQFAEYMSNERTIRSSRFTNAVATYSVNQNLMEFYSTYPTSLFGENICSRWAMYANTPMETHLRSQLYPQLKSVIAGRSQLEAAEILLNWVQTGFVYEYDDKVWGGDRAFFAEESLYYPYCDCEDRSILFTRLVRDLLGLRCILIYYPGHLASAVQFTDAVNGDYIMLNGKRFIVTDPTYIGAPVGRTMPDMDNQTAKVILLE